MGVSGPASGSGPCPEAISRASSAVIGSRGGPSGDEERTVRTPLTIFALGLGCCLAMGLLMQHLVRVSQERNQPPVLNEVNRMFGPRLDCPAKLKYVRRSHGKLAELVIRPIVTGAARDLAREIGAFVWRSSTDPMLVGVELLCEDPLGGNGVRFVVERPAIGGRPSIGVGSGGPAPSAPALGAQDSQPGPAGPAELAVPPPASPQR